MNRRQIGNKSEDLAVSYLKKLGFNILDRNFTIRGGEIDIIAQLDGTVVFIEVKARYNHNFGLATEAITYFKMKALQRCALVYLNKMNLNNVSYRFDLVAIDYSDDEKKPKIEYIQNIIS